MGHWNHRVVRRTYPDGTTTLSIHEAFCDSDGLVWGITEDPVSPLAVENFPRCPDDAREGIPELKEVLGWMLKACDTPILDYDKIPEEGAKSPDWGNLEVGDETDPSLHTEE